MFCTNQINTCVIYLVPNKFIYLQPSAHENFSANFVLLQIFPDIDEFRISEAIIISEKSPIITVSHIEMHDP